MFLLFISLSTRLTIFMCLPMLPEDLFSISAEAPLARRDTAPRRAKVAVVFIVSAKGLVWMCGWSVRGERTG